jgi:hypothetical protein
MSRGLLVSTNLTTAHAWPDIDTGRCEVLVHSKDHGSRPGKGSLAFRLAAAVAAAAGAAHRHAERDHGDGEKDGEGAGQVEAVS